MKRFLAGLLALLLACANPALATVPLTGAGKSAVRVATYVGKIVYTATACHATVNFPAGVATGDLVFIHSISGAGGQAVAGWTLSNDAWGSGVGLTNATYWKFLSSGDVAANAMTFDCNSGTPDTISVYAYRVAGATAAARQVLTADAAGAAGTTITNSGFTPAATHYILLCFTDDASRTTTAIIAPSSNATMRDQTVDTQYSTMVGDIYPYVGGTITYGSASSATNRIMACYEVS